MTATLPPAPSSPAPADGPAHVDRPARGQADEHPDDHPEKQAGDQSDKQSHDQRDNQPDNQADLLRRLEAELLAMPPVAALGLRIAGAEGERLRLHAPLAPNINDKGCAFGGSLSALMTLAGWSLLTLRLMRAGVDADVYVAESEVKYRAPLFEDLLAEARPAVDAAQARAAMDACAAAVARHGRGELQVDAEVRRADGLLACRSRSRFVAKRRS